MKFAILLLATLQGGAPADATALNERALQALEEQQFDEAVTLLEQALRAGDDAVIRRNLAVARNNRGLDHLREGRLGPAAIDFDAAVRMFENDALFRVHLGYAYLLARDYPRAEAVLLDCRRRHPEEPKVYDFLGFLHYSRDELEPAIDAFRARLELQADAWAEAQLARALREHEVSGEYVDRSSNDFTLKFLGNAGNYAIADDVLGILEAARARVCSDLGHYPRHRTTVLLYSDLDFKRATGAHDWVGGLYDGKIRLPVRDYRAQRAQLVRTALHEYTHRVVADLAPSCPVWVNEGLAEWFEWEGRGAHDEIRELVRGGADPPRFRAMPKSFASESNAKLVRIQYAASRSFMAFLRDRHGLGSLRALVAALGRGDAIDAALVEGTGYDLGALEATWRREVLR